MGRGVVSTSEELSKQSAAKEVTQFLLRLPLEGINLDRLVFRTERI